MLKYKHSYDLKQEFSVRHYGSFDEWAQATYEKNKEALVEHNIRYETFKENIKGYIDNSKKRRKAGKTTHQYTAEEAMRIFERSEWYTTERDRYKENLYNAIRRDKDLLKKVNKEIANKKGKGQKFSKEDLYYNDLTGRYEYGGTVHYDEQRQEYVSEGGFYIQFEYVRKNGQSYWVGIIYNSDGEEVGIL